MKKSLEEFKLHWKNYVFQSLFATFAVFLVFWALTLRNAVVVASLGSTAFVIFAMPNQITAKVRNVIGGYTVSLLSGFLCSLIPVSAFFPQALVYASAVGLSIFLMVVTDTEHPAASGLALAVAIQGFSWNVTLTVIVSVAAFSLIHHFSKGYMRDLT